MGLVLWESNNHPGNAFPGVPWWSNNYISVMLWNTKGIQRLACFLSLQMCYRNSLVHVLECSGCHALVTQSLAVCTTGSACKQRKRREAEERVEGASPTAQLLNCFIFLLLEGRQVLLSCDCYDRKQGITWMLTGISNTARLILNQKYSTFPCSW